MHSSLESQTADFVMKNVVKIVDKYSEFFGTGFLIEVNLQQYCITCHHCIFEMEEIFIQKGNEGQGNAKKYNVKWFKELSDMANDLAVLKLPRKVEAKPLLCNRQALRGLPVIVFGYAKDELQNFPRGRMIENCSLSATYTLFHWDAESKSGSKEWNQKPEVNVNVFGLQNFFSAGQSGAPVCYKDDYNVVGIFTAKIQDKLGFVIPIQTLLDKFDQDKSAAKQSIKIMESQPSNTQKVLNEGNQLLQNKKYQEAIKKYDEIIDDVNYENSFIGKAYALGSLGRYNDAKEWIDKALVINPGNVVSVGNKAVVLFTLGRYKEAIEWYDMALAMEPNNINFVGNKGIAMYAMDRYLEAIRCYNKVLAIDRNNITALNNKGLALYNLGKYKQAIYYLDKALAIDPNNSHNLSVKVLVLSKLGKIDEIKKNVEIIMAIDPFNDGALGNIALALSNLGNDKEAVKWYNKALSIRPNDINNLLQKGVSLFNLGKYKLAIKCYDNVLAISPTDLKALLRKGVTLDELRKYKEAIKWYDKALAIDPNYTPALNNRGWTLANLGKYKEAIKWYDKALAIDPNYTPALNNKKDAIKKMRRRKVRNIQ